MMIKLTRTPSPMRRDVPNTITVNPEYIMYLGHERRVAKYEDSDNDYIATEVYFTNGDMVTVLEDHATIERLAESYIICTALLRAFPEDFAVEQEDEPVTRRLYNDD